MLHQCPDYCQMHLMRQSPRRLGRKEIERGGEEKGKRRNKEEEG